MTKLAVVIFFFTIFVVVSAIVHDPKCAGFRGKGYEIAMFLPGINVSTKVPLFWPPVDLLEFQNSLHSTMKGIFVDHSARLLLGYDDEIFVFPHRVGRVLTNPLRFVPMRPKLDSWKKTNRSKILESWGETSLNLGELDPADLTLFQDILFAGDKAYNLTSNEMVENIDFKISYSHGNHFDLRNETSVAGKDPSKKLIGVVGGIKIYRKHCERRNPLQLVFFCFGSRCHSVDLPGIDNCFYMDECEIAYGSELIFHSILVLPKDPISRPVLSPLATTEASTEATSIKSSSKITTTEGTTLAASTEGPKDYKDTTITPVAPTTTFGFEATEAPEYPKDTSTTVTTGAPIEPTTSEGSTSLETTSKELSTTKIPTRTKETKAPTITKSNFEKTTFISSATGASQSTSTTQKAKETTVTQGITLGGLGEATPTLDPGVNKRSTTARTPTTSQASKDPSSSKRSTNPVSVSTEAFQNEATTSTTSTTPPIEDQTNYNASRDSEDPRSKEALQNEATTKEPHNDHQTVFLVIFNFGLFFFVLFAILFVLTWRGVLCDNPKRRRRTEFDQLGEYDA
ncbi:hypothetical protein L596_025467 [Steinernema carpocapsae]|uniref:Uncharacterized protein n=1 Tax=Steinernema carpocapsae TaxID=34508 RepID=A0A4U5M8P4_STECR|nr:hypothetical protein L596_025467 [Steinernema carpocapsae]